MILYNLRRIKFDRNKILALIFIIFIFSFAIGTGIKVIKPMVKSVLIRLKSSDLETTTTQRSNLYNEVSNQLDKNKLEDKSKETTINKIYKIVDTTILSIDTKYNANIPLKSEFINLNGGIELLLNKKIVEDVDKDKTIFKLDNDQLTFVNPEYETDYCVDNMLELYKYLNQKDIDMLYIQAPFKVNKYSSKLSEGLSYYTNQNADKFLGGLKKNHVPYLDLRETIKNENLDYDKLFYNTDHHWKTETAFWAYQNVMCALGANYDKKTIDINNFISIEYKKSFLGSQGRRVGKWYGGIDDYTLIYPLFETNYNIETLKNDGLVEKSGSFKDTIIINSNIDENEPITTNRYAAYFGGDYPLVKVTNKNISNGKILIVQDSFGLPFSAFMSLNFKQTDILDLRHFREQTLFQYIDENEYDIVLFVFNPTEYSSNTVLQDLIRK